MSRCSKLVSLFAVSLSLFAACSRSTMDTYSNGNKSQGGVGSPGVVGNSEKAIVGASCKSSDPNSLCLALKYVVYKSKSDHPIMNEIDVAKTVKGINKVWTQCGIQFQVDEFHAIAPRDYGLDYNTSNDSDLYGVRKAFTDESTLLVVNTGTWDRTGSLGNTGANAWTSMPGDAPYGVVLEKPVDTFSNIVAHELGHYLNLLHESDTGDLMNPIIYDNSTTLSDTQCSAARSAATTYWRKMMR